LVARCVDLWGSRGAMPRRHLCMMSIDPVFPPEETLSDIEPKAPMAPTPIPRRARPGLWPTQRIGGLRQRDALRSGSGIRHKICLPPFTRIVSIHRHRHPPTPASVQPRVRERLSLLPTERAREREREREDERERMRESERERERETLLLSTERERDLRDQQHGRPPEAVPEQGRRERARTLYCQP